MHWSIKLVHFKEKIFHRRKLELKKRKSKHWTSHWFSN